MLKELLVYCVGRVVPAAVSFYTVSHFSSSLGAAEYGLYAINLAYGTFFSSLLFMWQRTYLVRFFGLQEPGRKVSEYIATTFLLITGFVFISVLFLAFFVADISTLIFIASLVIALSFFELNLEFLRVEGKFKQYSIVSSIRALIFIGIAENFDATHHTWSSLYLALILGYAVPVIYSKKFLESLRFKLNFREFLNELRMSYRFSLPLIMSFGISFLSTYIDRYLISSFIGNRETGYYAASFDIVYQLVVIASSTLSLPLLPRLIARFNSGQDFSSLARIHFSLLFTILFAVVLCCTFYCVELTSLFFSAEYQHWTSQLVPFIAISAALVSLKSYYFDYSFQLGNKNHLQVYISLFCLVASVVLITLFINLYGLMGVAYAGLINSVISLSISYILGRKIVKLSPIDSDLILGVVIISTSFYIFSFIPNWYIGILGSICISIVVFLRKVREL